MTMDIKVKIQNQDKILECLSAVFDIVQGIKRTEDSSVVLDLSDIHIPSPVFTLPLSILLPDKSAELTMYYQMP